MNSSNQWTLSNVTTFPPSYDRDDDDDDDVVEWMMLGILFIFGFFALFNVVIAFLK